MSEPQHIPIDTSKINKDQNEYVLIENLFLIDFFIEKYKSIGIAINIGNNRSSRIMSNKKKLNFI
jgi:hypothetical protein